jgi:hypothetical protein
MGDASVWRNFALDAELFQQAAQSIRMIVGHGKHGGGEAFAE